ncbi:MAG: hypothetical protein LBE56_01015 [Tannerella sp.]|jgi:hypothetical protein|nr:hypothetical protein [Tannerella sp.]
MSKENNIRESILERAKRLLHYNNLLIEQSERWLSAEEGNRNLEQKIAERKKIEKEEGK